MTTYDSILVSVATGAPGELAIERAARVADPGHTRVTLAISAPMTLGAAAGKLESWTRPLLDRGIEVTVKPLTGRWSDALASQVENLHPDLVIQAGARDDVWPKGLRMSPTERLLTASRVPTWVVRLAPAKRPRVIVAALGMQEFDDPVHDAHVLSVATALANRVGATLHVLSHGILLSECGAAQRLAPQAGNVTEATAASAEALRADLVVVGNGNGRTAKTRLRRLFRSSHASLLSIPPVAETHVGRTSSRPPAPLTADAA